MDDELRAYAAASAEAKMLAGMSREEALRAARVEMGSVEAVKEQIRDAGWERAIESLWQDIRYGVRMLRKSPGFTIVAIITLALGIGANTAIFSMVYEVLLKPLPYPGAGRMLLIHESLPQVAYMNDSWPDFLDWRDQNHVFEQIAALQPRGANLMGIGAPKSVPVGWVSSAMFPLFGVKPILGRTFGDADQKPGAPGVTVLSHWFWRDVLHSDPHVVGRVIVLDHVPTTIVGVLPSGFAVPGWAFQLYLPIGQKSNQSEMISRANHPGIVAYAKLRRGATLHKAQTEMETIMARLAREYPQSHKHEKAILTPLMQSLVGRARSELLLLLAAASFVLLLACANIAHMALARGIGRQREFAVRAALGAGRARLARQLLVEHVLLALAGGAAGVALAWLSVPSLVRMYPQPIFRLRGAHVSGSVLLFAVGISLLATVLFGLAPAMEAQRTNPSASLKEGERGGTGTKGRKLRSALLVVEIALALVLTVGAGLMMRSLWAAANRNPGFRSDHLFELDLPPTRALSANPSAVGNYLGQFLDRVRQVPGVDSASAALSPPLEGIRWTSPYEPGTTPPDNRAPWTAIDPVTFDYLQTVGARLIAGRFFTPEDENGSAPVAIVNEAMARTIPGTGTAFGKQIYVTDAPAPQPLLQVIGVVADMKQWSLDTPEMPEVFIPDTKGMVNGAWIVVRTKPDPALLERPVIDAIHALDKTQPLGQVKTFDAAISAGLTYRKFLAFLFGLFSGLALVLAVVGVSGAMAYAVDQRRREIGIRTAFGAHPGDVLRLVLGQGMSLATVGIALGIGGALASARLLRGELFQVKPTDPATLAGVAALIAVVALAACWLPARRAARVDPMSVLRHE